MKKGFSLIELLVAIAIIAGLGIIISQSFFATSRSSVKVEKLTEVKQSGEYAMGIMERMIRNARSLTAASCTPDGAVMSPSVAIINPDGYETTFSCAMDSGVTRIASTSSFGTEYLTSSSVQLGGSSCEEDTLAFYCTSIAGTPRSVAVSFRLSQKGTPTDAFEKASTTFQTGVAIRSNE